MENIKKLINIGANIYIEQKRNGRTILDMMPKELAQELKDYVEIPDVKGALIRAFEVLGW